MTKEEAIRKLQKQKAEYLEEFVDFSGVAEAYDMAIEALEQQKQQWIPCSESLPGAYQHVLRTVKKLGWSGEKGYVNYLDVDIGTYNTNDGSIVAWMPLPKPYEAERKEE